MYVLVKLSVGIVGEIEVESQSICTSKSCHKHDDEIDPRSSSQLFELRKQLTSRWKMKQIETGRKFCLAITFSIVVAFKLVFLNWTLQNFTFYRKILCSTIKLGFNNDECIEIKSKTNLIMLIFILCDFNLTLTL